MRLKNKSDLYIIAEKNNISKQQVDYFISRQLEFGMIEELCDGWYVDNE